MLDTNVHQRMKTTLRFRIRRSAAAAVILPALGFLFTIFPLGRASAQVVLLVDPGSQGVGALAVTSNLGPVFSADSDTPTLAISSAVGPTTTELGFAALDDTASESRQFTIYASAEAQGQFAVANATAGTATSALTGAGTPVTFRIVGLGGETGQVVVVLTTDYVAEEFGLGQQFASQSVNGTSVPVPVGAGGPTVFNLMVGDTFTYTAQVFATASTFGPNDISLASGFLKATVTVAPSSAAVPEPGAYALLGGLAIPATLLLRRRRA